MNLFASIKSLYARFAGGDGSWHETPHWKMRRKASDGTWQYRDMTAAEEASYKDDYEARQY